MGEAGRMKVRSRGVVLAQSDVSTINVLLLKVTPEGV